MTSHQENRSELENSATPPRNNVEWVEAIVKWTRYDYVAMYDYPTTNNSQTVMEIYKGDMVQISRRYRREDWCLCQVGHVLGWVFLKDVRFIAQNTKPPVYETQTIYVSSYQDEDTAAPMSTSKYDLKTEPAVHVTEIKQDVSEVETAPALAGARAGASGKQPMVQRLINFFRR